LQSFFLLYLLTLECTTQLGCFLLDFFSSTRCHSYPPSDKVYTVCDRVGGWEFKLFLEALQKFGDGSGDRGDITHRREAPVRVSKPSPSPYSFTSLRCLSAADCLQLMFLQTNPKVATTGARRQCSSYCPSAKVLQCIRSNCQSTRSILYATQAERRLQLCI